MGAINPSVTCRPSGCLSPPKIMVSPLIPAPCRRRSRPRTSTSMTTRLKACGIGNCPCFLCSFIRKHRPDHTTPVNSLHRFLLVCCTIRKGKTVPKRQDLQKILLIGSGPIVIGQACEFDYSGTQACKALKEEGYSIVLVNSNPATIMTDPDLADRTYLEPLTPDVLEKIIRRERPQALLPTMGGQTALNLAVTLAETGVLERYGVELIGAKLEAIKKAEDRDLFKHVMQEIGLVVPRSACITNANEAPQVLAELGLPLIIRPSFTLGGTGGDIAHTVQEFEEHVAWGLVASPRHQVLIEESVLGWKEYELEVMRDLADNVVIICSIENVDAMGVHTGDSITVAPAQTLSDKEYQHMRDAAVRIIRMCWYSLSLRVCAGATVMLSPVCTPMASTFSMEQIITTLSARSRITSSSYSFHPSTDSSMSTWCRGLATSPQATCSSNSWTVWAISPPVPPRVKEGRMISGRPSS